MEPSVAPSILIVEDDPDQARLAEQALSREAPGRTIRIAESAARALELLDEETFQLMLVDYRLPDMDGVELLREVRRRGYDTAMVMVTGRGRETVAVEAMKAGACDYIIKREDYLPLLHQRTLEAFRRSCSAPSGPDPSAAAPGLRAADREKLQEALDAMDLYLERLAGLQTPARPEMLRSARDCLAEIRRLLDAMIGPNES